MMAVQLREDFDLMQMSRWRNFSTHLKMLVRPALLPGWFFAVLTCALFYMPVAEQPLAASMPLARSFLASLGFTDAWLRFGLLSLFEALTSFFVMRAVCEESPKHAESLPNSPIANLAFGARFGLCVAINLIVAYLDARLGVMFNPHTAAGALFAAFVIFAGCVQLFKTMMLQPLFMLTQDSLLTCARRSWKAAGEDVVWVYVCLIGSCLALAALGAAFREVALQLGAWRYILRASAAVSADPEFAPKLLMPAFIFLLRTVSFSCLAVGLIERDDALIAAVKPSPITSISQA